MKATDVGAAGAVLRSLSARVRRACTLTWVDGLTHEQVGRLDGVSKWASMKRVQRARRRLRALGVEPPPNRPASLKVKPMSLGGLENV